MGGVQSSLVRVYFCDVYEPVLKGKRKGALVYFCARNASTPERPGEMLLSATLLLF